MSMRVVSLGETLAAMFRRNAERVSELAKAARLAGQLSRADTLSAQAQTWRQAAEECARAGGKSHGP